VHQVSKINVRASLKEKGGVAARQVSKLNVRASLKRKGGIAAHQFSKLSVQASPKEKAGIAGRAARQFSELSARASLKCKGGIAARCNFKTKSPRTKTQNEKSIKDYTTLRHEKGSRANHNKNKTDCSLQQQKPSMGT